MTAAGPGWQEDPAVLAMWDQRRSFGGWGMICHALVLLERHDLFGETAPGATARATISLDRLLARHGSVPDSFKEAFFRDRLALAAPHKGEPYTSTDAHNYQAACSLLQSMGRFRDSHRPFTGRAIDGLWQ